MNDMNGLIAFYGTKSLEATKRFYQDHLRFPLLIDQGSCLVFGVPGGGSLGFCLHMNVPENPRDLFITYVVKDVESIASHLVEKGVEMTKAPTINDKYGILQALFVDPNGYTFEVQRFL